MLPTRTRRRRPPVLLGTTILALALVAGCSSGSAMQSESEEPARGYPVTLDNCGTKVTFDAPPERVVSIKSAATETLLALGLGDRIVGQAFADGPVPGRWSKVAAQVPVLSDNVPSQEAVLERNPDLVLAGWESNFSADGAGERDSLQSLGAQTYVLPAACREPRYQPEDLDFDDLFAQIEQVGEIFGVRDRAERFAASQRKQLATIEPAGDDLSALWYSSGSDIPYVGGGIGTPQMILNKLGLKNVAGDVEDTWTSMNWEKIVAANPDVIVLVDASWNTAADKIDRLNGNPATAKLDAVRHDRYLTIPFPASEAGVRTVPATVDMSDQLARLGVVDHKAKR